MSCVETETVVSATGLEPDDGEFRHRKKARIEDTLQLLAANEFRPRRVCRRHSYAFRCTDHEIDEDDDYGKHYESILFVRV
jgi:3',5'-cyclic AMP phosphodiesterase CpdA